MAEDEHTWVFSDVLPLPFRVLFLLQLGIHLWYALVWHCYNVHKMNVLALLNLSYSPHKYNLESHNMDNHTAEETMGEYATSVSAELNENQILLRGIVAILKKTLPVNVAGIVFYWLVLVLRDRDSFFVKITARFLPVPLLVYTFVRTFGNGPSIGSTRMFTTLKRILVGNINSTTMRTNDILISDSLTSYSKVVNDLGSFLWTTFVPTSAEYNVTVQAVVLSLPGLIRVRQCWYEYRLTRQRQHFFNMIKYCCQLAPIVVNLFIRIRMAQLTEDAEASSKLNNLNMWWYVFSTISSTYSFIWDVRMDWGFGLFEPVFQEYLNFNPLRDPNKLVYNNFFAYYGVIVVDLVLRFVWVLKVYVIKETEVELGLRQKVGNFLFGYDFQSFGFVVLEVLEILRRWLWCFIKLESDLIKLRSHDDIPLATLKS